MSERSLRTKRRAALAELSPKAKKPKIIILKKTIPSPNKPSLSLIQQAKTNFRRCSTSTFLIGRSQERGVIGEFWDRTVGQEESGALYISGCPGTGKTALVDEIVDGKLSGINPDDDIVIKVSKTNCMTVNSPVKIFSKILKDLTAGSKQTSVTELSLRETMDALDHLFIAENTLKPKRKTFKRTLYLIILDEIDHLVTKDQDILYRLFEWPSLVNSKLILIGIANALDLTTRFLPRLEAKNCEPQLLNFNPYKINEISAIIKSRLMVLNDDKESLDIPVMSASAIEFTARKVVGTGDLRKALDICRQAIETMEIEYKKSSNDTAIIPKVSIQHVNKVTAQTLGSAATGTNRIRDLHMHQQVVVGVLFLMEENKESDLSLKKLMEMYFSSCKKKLNELPPPVSRSEFIDLVNLLETIGILKMEYSKAGGGSASKYKSTMGPDLMMRKCSLLIHRNEVLEGVSGSRVLKQYLEEELEKIERAAIMMGKENI